MRYQLVQMRFMDDGTDLQDTGAILYGSVEEAQAAAARGLYPYQFENPGDSHWIAELDDRYRYTGRTFELTEQAAG